MFCIFEDSEPKISGNDVTYAMHIPYFIRYFSPRRRRTCLLQVFYIHIYSPYNMVAQATQEQEYDKRKEKNNDSFTLHNAQELKH